MIRKLILIAVVALFSSPALSQNSILLKGKINADSLHDSSVHIINITQKTGTVNTSAGKFEIVVKENDVILFSSIEFENREIIITPEVFQAVYLEVELFVAVNLLDDVNLSNITFTGNINTDIKNIKTVKGLPFGLSAADLKDIRFKSDINDPLKSPENLALKQNQIHQTPTVDFIAVAKLVKDILNIKTPKKEILPPGYGKPVSLQMKSLFSEDFFISSLKLKKEKIQDFLFYLDDQDINRQLLLNENRMALIELLIDHSDKYRALTSEN
ncbi:hypothetical protein BH23BAC2_BH23BAC2_10560 [soil metagenome]